MSEKPDLQQYLKSLERDIQLNRDLFRNFSLAIVEEGISMFPIYIVSGTDIAMGRPFLNKKDHDVRWNYHASFLEEFIKRGVIQEERSEDFEKAFGNPFTRGCFFFIIGDKGSFVFIDFETENPA